MKRNLRLFFSEQDRPQALSSLRDLSQNHYTQEPKNNTETLHYPNHPTPSYAALSESLESNKLLREREETGVLILQKFKADLSTLSTDSEKLDYIAKISTEETKIIANKIIESINGLNYGNIQKIDHVSLIELLILAKIYRFPTMLANKIGVREPAILGKLPNIGLQWEDLLNTNSTFLRRLDNFRYRCEMGDESLLDKTIGYCLQKKKSFTIEANFEELHEAFALHKSLTDIAQQFCVRDRTIAGGYCEILDCLKNKFPYIRDIESKLYELSTLEKIRYLSKLTYPLDNLSNSSKVVSESIECNVLEIENSNVILEFYEKLDLLSTDDERLDYINNLSIKSRDIVANAIIKKLNEPHYSGIRKLDNVTIMEFVILAKTYPYLSDFTRQVGINFNAVSQKLPFLGLTWLDLSKADSTFTAKLSNIRHRYMLADDISCLSTPFRYYLLPKMNKFNIEQDFAELHEAFALDKSLFEIAQRFCVREKVIENNYNRILKCLRNKFPIVQSFEPNVAHLPFLEKIQYLCKLTRHEVAEPLTKVRTVLQEEDGFVIATDNDEFLQEDDNLFETLELFLRDDNSTIIHQEDDVFDKLAASIAENMEQSLLNENILIDTHNDSTITYKEDDIFDKVAASIAENYEQFLQNDILLGIHEDFIEKLLSICAAEESITMYHDDSTYRPGLFSDKTNISSNRKGSSDVSCTIESNNNA